MIALPFPHGQTVTRLRAALISDPYSGEQALDWGQVDEQPIPGCALAPAATSELTEAERQSKTTRATLYVPHGTGITAADRIRIADGREWLIDGDPAEWTNPLTGWAPGVTVNLIRRGP